MYFSYTFSDYASVDFEIEINSQKSSGNVTYVRDCLGSLLNALMYINPSCVPQYIDAEPDSFCEWDSEPLLTSWKFTSKPNGMLHVFVTSEYYEQNEDGTSAGIKKKVDIDTECSYDDFLEVVIQEADSLIKKHGIVGYYETWDFEFPLSTFLKLKNYLLNKKGYPLKSIGEEDDGIKQGDLKNDIELLFK